MRILILLSAFIYTATSSAQSVSYMEWVDRSANYIEENKLDSAALALQRAMSQDPANEHNPLLLLNLGIMQRQMGQLDEAYISFTASLANNPMPAVVLHNRASLLCDMERYDEAMEDYDAIIRLFPQDVEAYYRRGLLYLENNDRVKAEADFTAADKIDPNNMYSRLSQSLLFKLDDNWESAAVVYTQLLDTEENPDPIFYMNRAECFLNMNQVSKASSDLQTAWNSQRNNPYFYILRGRVRLAQFDKTAAREDFAQAKSMGYDADLAEEWLKRAE